jgi:hypothetical protein
VVTAWEGRCGDDERILAGPASSGKSIAVQPLNVAQALAAVDAERVILVRVSAVTGAAGAAHARFLSVGVSAANPHTMIPRSCLSQMSRMLEIHAASVARI